MLVSPQVIFPQGVPDTSEYAYSFLLGQEGIFTQLTDQPDLRAAIPGNYQVCGFFFTYNLNWTACLNPMAYSPWIVFAITSTVWSLFYVVT
ncbi:MAG: hypothetical protein R2795_04185 [Saprospiraceae bacterium]